MGHRDRLEVMFLGNGVGDRGSGADNWWRASSGLEVVVGGCGRIVPWLMVLLVLKLLAVDTEEDLRFWLILVRLGAFGELLNDENRQKGQTEVMRDRFRKKIDISGEIRILWRSQIRAEMVS